jgi:ribosomal protein L11 methyltransferase
VSVRVAAERGEAARARMLELFPTGFEELERPGFVELAAYTDPVGENAMREAFAAVESLPVAPDWGERWREFHRGVAIGPFWVGPPWQLPEPGKLAVVIDPGRAFGTGSHPTTRLCLELLTDAAPGRLIDVGCGSGVLAIAAVKLGRTAVVALDIDADAVIATRTNAERNGVMLEARRANAITDPLPGAEVVIANLTLEQVESLAPRLTAAELIASGYLETDDPVLPGFVLHERRVAEGWAADVFKRVA